MQIAGAPRARATIPSACRQRGFFAIIILVILVMGSLYAIVGGLSTAATEARLHREDVTALALQQAKEALIARAALDANRPGSLPCPDRDNDGIADLLAGNNCPSYIGRLPWKTLGLPDLRDAAGERLWYAFSQSFTDSDAFAINSDTQGTLVVPGMAPAGGIVGIVFAPGTVAGAQTRGGPGGTSPDSPCTWTVDDNCRVANYLEGDNASIDTTYELSPRCERADCPGGMFNDQLMIITHADLFNVVENVVAKRLETEIAALFRYYRDRWAALGTPGFFPLAVPFMNPGPPGGPPLADVFCGAPGQPNGLVPITFACLGWNPAAATVAETGAPSGFFVGGTCVSAPAGEPDTTRIAALKCAITYTGGSPSVAIAIPPLLNAGATLTVAEQATIKFGAPPAYLGPAWGGGLLTAAIAGADITLQYSGNLPPQLPGGPYTATITIPVYEARTRYEQTAGVDTSWFFDNEWYRNTYYSVVPQRLPGAGGTCTAGTNCLTVLNLPGTNDDKEAVFVLAGRTLPGKVRPSGVLANYFEAENDEVAGATAGTFERSLRSASFNDKVVVVAP
jgi:hypothetical protein